ncbi:SDH family Clp fold serine proteinase [Halarchaeum sp. P4]|uniref:SDH family Clp fold serine proteinase n=1 Tax=Halarchaeum sp. P4 TaxID=3421639 RepID=UPI003EBC2FFB
MSLLLDVTVAVVVLLVVVAVILPAYGRAKQERERTERLQAFEQQAGTRVITMIHRQEALSMMGVSLSRYIDIEDSEAVLRAIRKTDDDVPIDIILHTPGGLVLAAKQIAWALAEHPADVTVYVPHYAMSGGTLLALTADEVVMDRNAVLGPVDPQLGGYAAASIRNAVERKDPSDVDDETLILDDMAEKALTQVERSVSELLEARGVEHAAAAELAETLSTGQFTHDYPIRVAEARDLGLDVSTEMPAEIYDLMELYSQPLNRRPSVRYIDAPYRVTQPSSAGATDVRTGERRED